MLSWIRVNKVTPRASTCAQQGNEEMELGYHFDIKDLSSFPSEDAFT
jgi:hypothetical protein